MAGQIDREVRSIIDEAYEHCVEILTEKREQLEQVAAYLLEHETMDAAAFEAVFAPPAPAEG